jgi:hypothetical protein
MLQNHDPIASAMEPDDLRMLRRVVEQICDRRGIIKDSERASDIATDVIDLFQHGVRLEAQLLAMLAADIDLPCGRRSVVGAPTLGI